MWFPEIDGQPLGNGRDTRANPRKDRCPMIGHTREEVTSIHWMILVLPGNQSGHSWPANEVESKRHSPPHRAKRTRGGDWDSARHSKERSRCLDVCEIDYPSMFSWSSGGDSLVLLLFFRPEIDRWTWFQPASSAHVSKVNERHGKVFHDKSVGSLDSFHGTINPINSCLSSCFLPVSFLFSFLVFGRFFCSC